MTSTNETTAARASLSRRIGRSIADLHARSLRETVESSRFRGARVRAQRFGVERVQVDGRACRRDRRASGQARITMCPSAAPTFEEVQQVAQWMHAGIERVRRAHGRTLDGMGDEPVELTHDQPVLGSLELMQPMHTIRTKKHTSTKFGGINIHAEVTIDKRDHKHLEHVLQHMTPPPLALARLKLDDNKHITSRFENAWSVG